MQPGMTTRNHRSAYLLAAGLVLIATGVALGSTASIFVGIVVVALAVRYRKNPTGWEYLCFVALLLADLAWFISTDSRVSPLVGAAPLILAYVFDYLDERRQKRALFAEAIVPAGASYAGRLAESGTAPGGSSATTPVNSDVGGGPPLVS